MGRGAVRRRAAKLTAKRLGEIQAMYARPVEVADSHSLRLYIEAVGDLLAGLAKVRAQTRMRVARHREKKAK